MGNPAMWLVRKELKQQWPALLATLLVTMVLAFIAAMMFDQSIGIRVEQFNHTINRFILDLLFIGMAPSFAALYMSAPYLRFRTIWEDPLSKRMAFYRAVPISIKVLAQSRMIFMLVTLLFNTAIFYTTLYLILPENFFAHISHEDFYMFVLLWFGYALFLSGINTYVEFGTSGKMLHLFPFIFVGLFIVIAMMYYKFVGKSFIETSFIIINQFGWGAILMSLMCGVLGCYAWYKILVQRLTNRDYM